jgi:hypothetical protein
MGHEAERRHAPRVPYGLSLHVAPYDGESFPEFDVFESVKGKNISTTGISYVSAAQATIGQQVVVLARADAAFCVQARVIHCQEVPGVSSQFIVGCVLERRLCRNA